MSTPATGQQPGRFEDPNDPYRFGRPETPMPGYEDPNDPYRFGRPETATVDAWGAPPNPYARVPQGQAGPYGYPPAAGKARQSAPPKAVWSLVLGVLSIVFFFATVLDLVLVVPAIILASLALNDTKQRRGPGRGVAVAGLTCAIIGALCAITFTVWAIPKVAKCANEYPTNSAGYKTCVQNIVK